MERKARWGPGRLLNTNYIFNYRGQPGISGVPDKK
jgi:hypothetical protein